MADATTADEPVTGGELEEAFEALQEDHVTLQADYDKLLEASQEQGDTIVTQEETLATISERAAILKDELSSLGDRIGSKAIEEAAYAKDTREFIEAKLGALAVKPLNLRTWAERALSKVKRVAPEGKEAKTEEGRRLDWGYNEKLGKGVFSYRRGKATWRFFIESYRVYFIGAERVDRATERDIEDRLGTPQDIGALNCLDEALVAKYKELGKNPSLSERDQVVQAVRGSYMQMFDDYHTQVVALRISGLPKVSYIEEQVGELREKVKKEGGKAKTGDKIVVDLLKGHEGGKALRERLNKICNDIDKAYEEILPEDSHFAHFVHNSDSLRVRLYQAVMTEMDAKNTREMLSK